MQRHSREWQGMTRHYYAITFGERYIWGVTAGIVRNLYDGIGDLHDSRRSSLRSALFLARPFAALRRYMWVTTAPGVWMLKPWSLTRAIA